jgi:hypothetical protein
MFEPTVRAVLLGRVQGVVVQAKKYTEEFICKKLGKVFSTALN